MDKMKALSGVTVVALVIAVIALVISRRGQGVDEAEAANIEKRVYQRMLDETWQEVKPVYKEFGVKVDRPPTSFGELIRPLVSVKSPSANASTNP